MVRLRFNILVGGRLYAAGSIVDEHKGGFEFVGQSSELILERLEPLEPELTADDEPMVSKKILVHQGPQVGVGRRHLVRKTK